MCLLSVKNVSRGTVVLSAKFTREIARTAARGTPSFGYAKLSNEIKRNFHISTTAELIDFCLVSIILTLKPSKKNIFVCFVYVIFGDITRQNPNYGKFRFCYTRPQNVQLRSIAAEDNVRLVAFIICNIIYYTDGIIQIKLSYKRMKGQSRVRKQMTRGENSHRDERR